jgi:Alw26I/Eco31I/Esp3I family type II restriction m6 adenine DNA methyltransferase
MEKPSFKKNSSAKLDEKLEEFFIQQLGYSAGIKNDPDEKPGEPHYWRMVFSLPNSRPFAIAYQANLSTMKRQDVARLYINKVVPHRDSTPFQPAPILYGFTDGARFVFFSADTARNRDDRFDLSEETWQFEGVRGKVEALRVSTEETPLAGSRDKVRFGNLIFQKRLGKLTPQVEFLFDSSPLSADNRFKNYVRVVRRHLMQEVVSDERTLAAVIHHLLETPEARNDKAPTLYADRKAGGNKDEYTLKKSLEELHLELKTRLGDAVAAAVDTLLLRYVMVRFLEAYYPEAMQGLLGSKEMLTKAKRTRKTAMFDGATGKQLDATLYDSEGVRTSKFSQEELKLAQIFSRSLTIDASKARQARTRQGEAAQGDLFALQNVEIVLEEEKKREKQLGGDFYLADLGQAARAIEETLLARRETRGSMLLQDFLARTGETVEEKGAARWQFRYEDLKPKTLQDYYEDSLSAAVQLTYNAAEDEFKIEVGTSNRQRKELGAYYTNEHLCRFMVERTVKPLFDERLERLRLSVERGTAQEARAAFEAVMNFSVCDPTMGSAPFLRSAFDYLVESTQYFQLHRHVNALKGRYPALYEEIVQEHEFLGTKGGRLDASGIGGWEWHVLRRVLYGVDIDLKAVCIACQTFALSSMRHLKQGERFPSYFNLNLKLGNALISPTRPADRARLAAEHGAEIAEMIRLRQRARSLPNTEEAYAELVELFNEVDRVRLPIVSKLVAERVYDVLEDFTDELRPFSWELEFPEIFFNADGTAKAAAGFDVVIGNPPWEAIKFNNNEFLRSISAGAGASVEDLCEENEAVASAYEHYRKVIGRWKAWVNAGGQYERQQGGRDRNKWRLATEVSWKLTQPQGAMSLVVPGGIIADEGGYALKRWIFLEGESHTFTTFDEANDVFSGTQGFTVTGFRKGRATQEVRHLEGLTRAEQLMELPFVPASLPIETIETMSPLALAIPCVRDEVDAALLGKLYEHPLIGNTSAAWYTRTVSYDYHMGHGREDFRRGGNIPLVEGKNIEQYEVSALSNIEKRVATRTQVEPNGQYRIACGSVAGQMITRRMLSTVIPHSYATGHSVNCFLVEGSNAERLYLVGVLNSFIIEWRIRQLARNNNVNKFMLAQLPVPRPPKADVERIAALVAALVTADARFKDLQSLLNGAKPATADAARHDLKCRIDAEVAHFFGLTEEELNRVLDAFDKVPVATKDRVRSHFKTVGTGKP